ncbi:MAG: T9SS type A sorting domain-containing protein, partial [candidate division WOR-3 bacterium]
IYTIDMKNNSSPFEGAVCGVRYLGNDFKTVFFGFPLYFMDQDQARAAAQQVMFDFGELYVAEEPKDGVLISGMSLSQNMPNPFTRKTVISYQLSYAGNVSLKVYNIAGQLVKTLVHERQERGAYSIHWDSKDDHGKVASSGVYFYRLQVDERSIIKKMTLLR